MSYSQTIHLQHNEIAAKLNTETGEITSVVSKLNNIPCDKEVFEPNGIFKKDYTKSWLFLRRSLTDFEFGVAFELAVMAKANTNSLEPLNDDTTVIQLVERFQISRNKVTPLFKKLFDLGVFAKFDVAKVDVPYKKYWVLNPYLSFAGKLINSDITRLFKGTRIEIEYSKI